MGDFLSIIIGNSNKARMRYA